MWIVEDCVNFTNSAFEQQRHGNGCIGLAAENSAALRVFENFGQMRCCPNNGLSSEWMAAAASSNTTLLKYFYPEDPLDAFVKAYEAALPPESKFGAPAPLDKVAVSA